MSSVCTMCVPSSSSVKSTEEVHNGYIGEYLTIPSTGEITLQHISDFNHQRKLEREKISLRRFPMKTLRLIIEASCELVKYCIKFLISHPLINNMAIPVLLSWVVLRQIDPNGEYGFVRVVLDKIWFYTEFSIWWIGLGIMSSIGLGSGLQSGVLFMFPHIFRVCLTAQTCKSIDFDSDSNMWFRESPNMFKCPEPSNQNVDGVTFFDMWSKVIVVCFLQALGTAIGEIPPYWMTRAARLAQLEAGESSAEDDDIPEELQESSLSHSSLVNQFKHWMVGFLHDHGFYGVLLMASFPNLAFDLCGICCGHYLMPFWTFFWATFLGKAVIRNGYQSIIYVALCHERYLERLIDLLQALAPDSLQIDHSIRRILEEGRANFQQITTSSISNATAPILSIANPTVGTNLNNASSSFIQWILPSFDLSTLTSTQCAFFFWQIFIRTVVFLFVISCIDQFAQYYQLTIDRDASDKLRERLPSHILKGISSSSSGKLHLPPPSVRRKSSLRAAETTSCEVVDPSSSQYVQSLPNLYNNPEEHLSSIHPEKLEFTPEKKH